MSTIAIVLSLFAICVGVYILQQTEAPPPFKWMGFLILFVFLIILFMKISGVSI